MTYVGGYGNSSAKIVVVGEAPGEAEEREGRPFVGPTGRMVTEMLANCGVRRDDVYMTNVVKHRPPQNDIRKLNLLGKTIQDYEEELWNEIHSIKPNVVLALGNTALQSLTGEYGIEKWRGSILQSKQGLPKVVSTIHPAALMHKEADGKMKSWKDKTYIQWDFERAVKQSLFKDLRSTPRNLIVCRSSLDLFQFLDKHKGKRFVSVDIETFRTFPLCISFAFNSYEAISVPLFNMQSALNPTGIGRSDMCYIWQAVAELLINPDIGKIGQNFKFDENQLLRCYNGKVNFGLKVQGFFFDTMLGFRTIYPELPGRLQFITSVLTEEPYYKDEGKEYNPKKDKLERLLLYNAKDAVVTYECFEREMEEMEENGQLDFFFGRVMPLHPFYSRLEQRGIRKDLRASRVLEEKYGDRERELKTELLHLTDGLECNANSWQQVAKLLYGVLKIPARAGTGEDILDALVRNTIKDPKKKRIVQNILEQRKVRKTLGTYINARPHEDGRLRTAVRIMLETGRTSTSVLKPPITTETMGLAFQTVTKHGEVGSDIRSMFVPDPGYVLIEADQSQAEARVVAVLANDTRLQKLFDYGVDTHRVTAGWIYGRAPDELLEQFYIELERIRCFELAKQINAKLKSAILDWERQMGKVFRHAGNLGMQKRTAAVTAGISEYRAGHILDRFHKTNPNIEGVFQKGIIECLQNNDRILVSPFGRRRQFLNKWGDELFKEAYPQIPQSTVSDQTKFAAQRIEKRAPWFQILQESHDSILGQCPIFKVDSTIPIIKEEFEQPIDFKNCSLPRGILVIPCDIAIGTMNWQNMEKVA